MRSEEPKILVAGKSTARCSHPGAGGFTLIELVVATAISALVIGIVSVCFSFALRVWQSSANQRPDHTLLTAELLQRQLAESDPTPINFEHGSRPLFVGSSDSICFITTTSVKAISKGVPVAVRYTYDAGSKVLTYAEKVMNPYSPESLEQFANGGKSPGKQGDAPAYGIDFPEFTLSYAGRNATEFSQSWTSTEDLPLEILLSWQGIDGVSHSMVCTVNSPFPIQVNLLNNPSAPGGLNP